jgi:hypothetical protein
MGGSFSRDKGARGERLAAALLKSVTGQEVVRAARNGVDQATDLLGLPGFAVEVKYGYSRVTANLWWEQAKRQAGNDMHPLLIYKKQGSRDWIIRIGLNALKSMSHLSDLFWAEVSPEVFGEMYNNGEFVEHSWKPGT